jgi:hypothetical protein
MVFLMDCHSPGNITEPTQTLGGQGEGDLIGCGDLVIEWEGWVCRWGGWRGWRRRIRSQFNQPQSTHHEKNGSKHCHYTGHKTCNCESKSFFRECDDGVCLRSGVRFGVLERDSCSKHTCLAGFDSRGRMGYHDRQLAKGGARERRGGDELPIPSKPCLFLLPCRISSSLYPREKPTNNFWHDRYILHV